jgi:uncharacterized protein (DUF1810 family)
MNRFVVAQERDYAIALNEVHNGKKLTHWIWYIFPQMRGLGHSYYAHLYGIKNIEEAQEYLQDEILGERLREITNALLEHYDKTAVDIFGYLDAMKVKSCMTLFDAISPNDIFDKVLDRFYEGKRCESTIRILNS